MSAFTTTGTTYKAQGKYEAALTCFNNQLTLARTMQSWQAESRALCNIGSTHVAQGISLLDTDEPQSTASLREGLKQLSPALQLAEDHDDLDALMRVLGYLGSAHDSLGEYEKGKLCHRRRIDVARQRGAKDIEGRAWCNLGNALRAQDRTLEAIECYTNDLRLCVELGDKNGEAVTCHNLAYAYGSLGDKTSTIAYFEKYVAVASDIDDKQAVCTGYGLLGQVYAALGEYDDAMNCLQTQLELAEDIRDEVDIDAIQDTISAVRTQQIERRLLSQEQAISALVAALEAAENKARDTADKKKQKK